MGDSGSEAIFRSAPMSLIQLYFSSEVASEIVTALGEAGAVHFRDLNAKTNAFQRAFVPQIRRLDEGLRRVRFLRDQMDHVNLQPTPAWDGEHTRLADTGEILSRLADLEREIGQLRKSQDRFLVRQGSLIEECSVLDAADRFFGKSHAHEQEHANGCSPPGTAASIDVIAGIVSTESLSPLERILWRALRGNLVLSSSQVDEPVFDAKAQATVPKSTFIIITHGEELSKRARQVASALDAHMYEAVPLAAARSSQRAQVLDALEDVNTVLRNTGVALAGELEAIGSVLESWAQRLARDKAVFEVLNLFQSDRQGKILVGEGWVPTETVPQIQQTMRRISEAGNIESPSLCSVINTKRTPPTYHKTNKVTGAFQAMVDVYAVASYQEVNPALPTVITFPFLFAVMFGDLGHGFILTLAALSLVLNERKLAKLQLGDIFDMAYTGRYMLLFMGCFSMYTGLLYNDLFSKSMTLFKSGWEWPAHKIGETVTAKSTGHTYLFGLDWGWHGTDNNLLFTNSYKMKLSVLMGYVHMSYSYIFSLVNALYFKSMIDVVGNFIPGLIFFQGIFGYLSVTIVYKWCVDWQARGLNPPSLLNMLINMFLAPGKIEDQLFPGQKPLQLTLVVLALLSVPSLLLIKPLYMKRQLGKQHQEYEPVAGSESQVAGEVGELTEEQDDDEENDGEGHHSFGDILIEQVIHTIEFCLNCVSHTASYLRLWALSLAHAQLSQVLWTMTLGGAFGVSGVLGVVMTVVLFAMWFSLTVAVLVLMEGTSAMLHALRLHWVESMSKYYIGEGKAFTPFSFEELGT